MEAADWQNMLLLVLWVSWCLLPTCLADVIVKSTKNNQTYTAFKDLPAMFGPPLPLTGFEGYANYVSPDHACVPPLPPPILKNYSGPWIGIVKRKNCSFVDKVLNAQRSGYHAVIVHNVGTNAIQPMGTNDPQKAQEVLIPSVFIGEDDAIMIKENFLYNDGCKLVLTDELPFNIQNYLIPFAITIGICFVVMLTFMIVKCVRDYRRSRRHRLSSRSLKKLPVHKFKKGDQYDCCAVCLEDYVDNDKLRILPCDHAYHTKCIDPWLTKNRRVCPVCKRKVFTGDERPSDLETDSEDENSPLINSDGGTQGGTFNNQRENPFQEAQRQAEERRRRRRRRRNVSRHIECGPEGYQRLAESTDDNDDDDDEEAEEEGGQRENKNDEIGSKKQEDIEGADAGGSGNEDDQAKCLHQQSPDPVSVVIHSASVPMTAPTGTPSSSGRSSVSSRGTPPGPVQIAVDVVNSPTPASPQSSQSNEDARSERDYVV